MFLPPFCSGGSQDRTTEVLVNSDTVTLRGADGGSERREMVGQMATADSEGGNMLQRWPSLHEHMQLCIHMHTGTCTQWMLHHVQCHAVYTIYRVCWRGCAVMHIPNFSSSLSHRLSKIHQCNIRVYCQVHETKCTCRHWWFNYPGLLPTCYIRVSPLHQVVQRHLPCLVLSNLACNHSSLVDRGTGLENAVM